MSMQASNRLRRMAARARAALAIMAQAERVRTSMTFSGGTRPVTSTMNRFSSKTRKWTFSRPTRPTARRTASWASTVEPCSASLRKRMLETGPPAPPAAEEPPGAPQAREQQADRHAEPPVYPLERARVRC